VPSITPEMLNGVGVVALVLIFAWLLATGRISTRRQVDLLLAGAQRENDDLRADRDVWRDNFLDQKGLMTQVLTNSETTNRLLRAIPHVGDHE
jgi:hypothetical protein